MSKAALVRRLFWGVLAAAVCAAPEGGRAADPQPYPRGPAAHRRARAGQRAARQLQPDRPAREGRRSARSPWSPAPATTRAGSKTALNSFGYYGGQVSHRHRRHAARRSRPCPPRSMRRAGEVPVTIRVDKGPLYHLRPGRADAASPARQRARRCKLHPGDPAVAADVLAAQDRMLAGAARRRPRARQGGHAGRGARAVRARAGRQLRRSRRAARRSRPDHDRAGWSRCNASYVRRRLLIHQGEQFDPRQIEKARQDLAQARRVLDGPRRRARRSSTRQGQLPVTVARRRTAAARGRLQRAYSTDLGVTAGVTWSHRNLFGNAERLDLGAAVTQLGGTASRSAGYNVTAALTQPDILVRDLDLIYNLQGIKESLDAYDRTAVLGGRHPAPQAHAGDHRSAPACRRSSRASTQEDVTRDYTLLQLAADRSLRQHRAGGPAGRRRTASGPRSR